MCLSLLKSSLAVHSNLPMLSQSSVCCLSYDPIHTSSDAFMTSSDQPPAELLGVHLIICQHCTELSWPWYVFKRNGRGHIQNGRGWAITAMAYIEEDLLQPYRLFSFQVCHWDATFQRWSESEILNEFLILKSVLLSKRVPSDFTSNNLAGFVMCKNYPGKHITESPEHKTLISTFKAHFRKMLIRPFTKIHY